MFCPKCGAANNDGVRFCSACGNELAAPQQAPVQQAPVQPMPGAPMPGAPMPGAPMPGAPVPTPATPGKGLAIASMVLGIVSFFCFGIICGILAIILGGVAKSKGCKSGMATAGIVCGVVGLALYIITLIFFNPFATLAFL